MYKTGYIEKIARFGVFNSEGIQNTETKESFTEIAVRWKILSEVQFFWKCGKSPWKTHLKKFIFSQPPALNQHLYSRRNSCSVFFNNYLLEGLPVVDSSSAIFGTRHSSDIVQLHSYSKSQWSHLEFNCIRVS